jgi:hypothetical protein
MNRSDSLTTLPFDRICRGWSREDGMEEGMSRVEDGDGGAMECRAFLLEPLFPDRAWGKCQGRGGARRMWMDCRQGGKAGRAQ